MESLLFSYMGVCNVDALVGWREEVTANAEEEKKTTGFVTINRNRRLNFETRMLIWINCRISIYRGLTPCVRWFVKSLIFLF